MTSLEPNSPNRNLISIVVPVHNRKEELKRALKSVISQTIQNFEVLVVDDYSDIDIKEILEEFNDNRIRFLRLDKKGNANVCRNKGIKEANGVYIAMLDSDDEWMPNHLEKKLNYLLEVGADGVFGSVIIDDSEKQTKILSRPFNEGELMVNYLLSNGWAPTPTHFYKTECVNKIMWDESLLRHQDLDFSVRFSKQFKFVPSEDYTCIVHWKKGESRTENFESQLKFIFNNKTDIQPIHYNKYFSNFYLRIRNRKDVDYNQKKFIRKQATFYIKHCTLTDFLMIEGASLNLLSKFILRLKYCIRIICS
jgi:glycosyltransferase involved in cell wall biosynthesis